MSERLIDAVCPHCEVQGTTVRVLLHEDGYTKLSRRCTACGGEWVHTFDHDWLAVVKNKKLQADNERLIRDVALVAERVRQLSDERDYAWAEVEKLRADLATQQGCCDGAAAQDAHVRREREEYRAEVEKLRAEIERLRAALQESACACSSIRECASTWARQDECAHLTARKALEGKP